VNTHPFDVKFVAFCPKFSQVSYVKLKKKKLFQENFSEIFCKPRLSLPKFVKIRSTFYYFFSGTILR